MKINDIEIEYLSHSGFIFKKDGHRIVIDPFLIGNPLAKRKPDDIKATDILVTHGHGDHLGDAVRIAKSNDCEITAVFELAAWCEKQGAKAQGMPAGGKMSFPWGSVHARTAMHASQAPDGANTGFPLSFLLDFGGYKIYHLGDTALIDDFKLVGEIYQPDLALVPIGGHYTMDVDEAVIATGWLKASKVIPMHYGTFPQIQADPQVFKDKVETKTRAECLIL